MSVTGGSPVIRLNGPMLRYVFSIDLRSRVRVWSSSSSSKEFTRTAIIRWSIREKSESRFPNTMPSCRSLIRTLDIPGMKSSSSFSRP